METSETIHPDKTSQALQNRSHRMITQVVRYTADATADGRVHLFYTLDGNIAVRFLNDSTIRLKLFFGDELNWKSTQAVEPVADFLQLEQSLRVEAHPEESVVTLATESLRVVVWKYPFRLQVFTSDGGLVYQTESISIDKSGAITWTAQNDETEHFYGLGEKTSFLDKRGERYENWNSDVYAPHVPEIEALYESIPVLLHVRDKLAYGVFLDNPGRTVFDMRARRDAYSIQTETGTVDLYIFFGPTIKQVIQSYTGLTGRMKLPPKWALGYHQSRYSYMDEEEVLELAHTFRSKQIPCDVIHLDIHYMDEYRVFTFDEARFPHPKKMMSELAELGFHVIPIVDPGVKQDAMYPAYRNGVLEDHFCKRLEGNIYTGKVWPGESAFPDFTNDRTAKWWGDQHRFYTDLGIKGIWNDMNEPAVFNDTKTMEPDVMHGNNGELKTHREMHNLYGMLMSKATYEALEEQLGGERPFVLTRAGYSGVQRYAAVWTGDNRSFWEHMAMAMPMVMNLGLSGVTFSGPDVGGFAHHTTGELLTRWTQMGAFFPFFRNHSALDTLRQEPWSFAEPYETIIRDYTAWRYRWMPHLYTLFHEASQTGIPVLRPLLLEYQSDEQVTNLSDQFLIGSGILAAPVYRPDTTVRTVYIPEGVWYDYWTGARYDKPGHILADAPIDRMPLYIKAGTVIAEQPLVQSFYNGTGLKHGTEKDYGTVSDHGTLGARETVQADGTVQDSGMALNHRAAQSQSGGTASGKGTPLTASAELLFHVYAGNPNARSSYTFYEDDGITFAYENGHYNLWEIEVIEGQELEILFLRQTDGYAVERSAIDIQIHHLSFIPSEIKGYAQASSVGEVSVTPSSWYFDPVKETLHIKASADVTAVRVR
ncbi:DUF5110 domain-containing protein [Alicyclobacillus curvatus]|nr:DUF5110 domain-containing protein [Alicyclobacillus curvatus]